MGSSCDKEDSTSSQFGGFPTPVSLASAQRQYHKAKHNNNNNKSNSNKAAAGGKTVNINQQQSVPEPFPPPTNKADIYLVGDFQDIDTHAQNASLKLAAESYSALANYLVRPAKNDIGRTRSFYVWIASQRLRKVVDFVGTKIPAEHTPLYTVLLILVKGWGNGYSDLFTKLCREVNIACRTVKGKVKGAGYILGEPVAATNDYCIVYINGAWRFVDPHWGSQYVITAVDKNDDWELLSQGGGGGLADGATDGDGLELGRVCDDFYFLTDPVAMVYTHLTLEPAAQLLARTVTEAEFNEMAYLKDSFFEFGMSTINQPKCVVTSDDKGRVMFEFGVDKSRNCVFSSSLYKSIHDPELNVVEGGYTYDQFVMLERVADKLRASVSLPRIGRYKFELHGKEIGSAEGYTAICEYAIDCHRPDFSAEPNPENTGSEWGPTAAMTKYKLEPVNQEGGAIHAKEGRAELRLLVKDVQGITSLRFKRKLLSVEMPAEELSENICYYKTDKEVVFLMKLPHQGKYTLDVLVKESTKNKSSGAKKQTRDMGTQSFDENAPKKSSYETICSYLIKSDRGCHDLIPYPPLDNKYGQTGNLAELTGHDMVLEPQSHPVPVIDPCDKGELTLTMTSNKPATETSSLWTHMVRFYHLDGEEEDSSYYALLHQDKLNVSIHVMLPKFGFYKLSIMSNSFTIYQYLICALNPNSKCIPFPETGSAWLAQFEVIQPRTGILEGKKKAHFKLRVPGAQKVTAVCGPSGQKTELSSKKNDMWEGDVMTDEKTGSVRIIGNVSSGGQVQVQRVDQPLLNYVVFDNPKWTSVHAQQEASDKESDERRREMDERKETEKEEADRQRREAEAKADRAEQDFNRNRQKYEKEEAVIRQKQIEEEKSEVAALAEHTREPDMKIHSSDLQSINDNKQQQQDWKVTSNEREDDHVLVKVSDNVTPRTERFEELEEEDLFEQTPRRRDGRNTNVNDKSDWHYYHSKLSQQMALEKLRESMRRRDHTMLKNAIVDCQSFDKLHNNQEVNNASKTLHIIELRKGLQQACDSRDCDEIRRELNNIRRSGLHAYLQPETREAMYLLETLDRTHNTKTTLDVSRKIMTEIRRYQNPPPVMHRVMQSAFLLLGEDEDSTESWKACQRLCNPQGAKGLNRKLYGFKASDVHPEIIARSKEILDEYDLSKVQAVSPGAVTFYVWAKGVIEEAEDAEEVRPESDQNSNVKPASRERQKEILGRLPATEPKKTRQYWKSIVSAQEPLVNKKQHGNNRGGGETGGRGGYIINNFEDDDEDFDSY